MQHTFVVILFLVFGIEYIIAGTPCSITQGVVNPVCTNKKGKENYCRDINQNSAILTPTFECTQCISNCDCKFNQYCSSAPGQVGVCKKFDKVGDDCFPYDITKLQDESFPESQKCATFFRTPSGQLAVDQLGACVAFKCRICSAWSGGGIGNCGDDDGVEEGRVCLPGEKQASYHDIYWVPAVQYFFPNLIWWAIFFVLLVITVGLQIFTIVALKKKSWKRKRKR